jgi:hypothetical protein
MSATTWAEHNVAADDPRHGTYAGYCAGCIATCCNRAYLAYRKRLLYDHHRGVRRTVDVTGFRRRVGALQAIGWSLDHLARELGCSKHALSQSLNVTSKVTLARHMRMLEVYRRLGDTPGPSDRARRRAARLGGAPPIAWDDDTMDDPHARPYEAPVLDVDTAWRELQLGDFDAGRRLPRADRVQLIDRWQRSGRALAELERAGWNPHRDRQLHLASAA